MTTMILAQARVSGEAGYAQQIETTAHHLTADEPVKRGGTNTGASPFELLLSSLGACTAITLRMYSERKSWSLGTITVGLRLVKEGDNPPRIERTIGVSEALGADQKARLLEIADKTPVSRALAGGVPIATTLD